jgi:threonine/homoserine/homoserine lactone efflux protein
MGYSSLDGINWTLLLAFCWFAWVGAVTPGPNTMLGLATAVNFGAASVRPHMLGVTVGTGLIMAASLAGMHGILLALPGLAWVLKWLGVVWLIWMGLRLLKARQLGHQTVARPPRAYESALLQLANGKGWMLITATAAAWRGVASPAWLDALLLTLIHAFSCTLALLVWAVLGQSLSGWLAIGRRLAFFNAAMGLSLIVTALWMAAQ